MNPPYEPLPERIPALYFQQREFPFTCIVCKMADIGASANVKYCKAPACQRVKAMRAAKRSTARQRSKKAK